MPDPSSTKPRVGLFVTCLVDLMRPSVGFAAAKLLEAAGCTVVVPSGQTCCGQPAYNSGDRYLAKRLARQTMALFAGCDYVLAPSGSCAAMLKHEYPLLFEAGSEEKARARAFGERVYELTAFLTDVRGMKMPPAKTSGTCTYHDSCSGLRELGIKHQPRALLAATGMEVREHESAEQCCGFGGAFAAKYPEISSAIADRKLENVAASDAPLLLAGDLGCLLHLAGRLSRQGSPIQCRHVAEVLAGELDAPAIAKVE
jgi:L-lactate dehydrogenase complex protein LldE